MLDVSVLKNKRVMVTGATGLIGKALVKKLLSCGAVVIAQVRDLDKAEKIFGDNSEVEFWNSDIRNIPIRACGIDYIIHGASITSSRDFVKKPADVIDIAYEGTRRVLELARENGVRSAVYLSSMEVYGAPSTDEKISEGHSANIDTMAVRSSYPESKRLCESLCCAYAGQYQVPVKVVRLTQTIGSGVGYNDGRVFAEFARCSIEGKDIVLKTKGETKRSYLHVDDAVTAILYVLLNGKNGEAYNAANESTYCSIYEMAEFVARNFSDRIDVVIEEQGDCNPMGYAPVLHMNLNTAKLQALGWTAEKDMQDMFEALIDGMKRTLEG